LSTARIHIKLYRHQRRRLEREARKTKDAAYRTRVQIVLHYNEGLGCGRIARALRCVPSHCVRTARRFLEEGEDGLVDRRGENGEPKVDEDLLEALRELVRTQPEDHGWKRSTWSRELLVKELARKTGVRVSIRTLGRMLAQLRARYGAARPAPKPDWEETRKKRRVRQILNVVAHLPRNEVAYYEDELDVHLNPKIGRDWMLPNTQKTVITPGKNVKRYVYGALAVDGRELIAMTSRKKNADGFVEFLHRLRAKNPRARRIHLVLDNYIIHKCHKTERALAQFGSLFALHFLPPYSPEYNKIERLWRDLHGSVTRNHRCRVIGKLMSNVRYWLRAESRRRSRRVSIVKRARVAA
jgi:transposase